MRRAVWQMLIVHLIVSFLFAGCGIGAFGQPPVAHIPDNDSEGATSVPFEEPKARDAEEAYRHRQEQLRLAVCPNEIGQVMVLMYHRMGDAEADWCRSRENFRSDLARLREQGYYPISMDDFLLNEIDVPLGKTPVVITFDDSDISQFRAVLEGDKLVVDPECALGIMEDFARRHPDFPARATFFLNSGPFGQGAIWREKLRYLLEHGHSLGNHTYSHIFLNRHSPDEIAVELGKLAKQIAEATDGYQLKGLALPFGISAKDRGVMVSGEYQGFVYHNLGIFAVGAGPTWAPVHTNFNPYYIARIQACDSELDKWLGYFERNPEQRYISDGDPSTVVVPERLKDKVVGERVGNKRLVLYSVTDETP